MTSTKQERIFDYKFLKVRVNLLRIDGNDKVTISTVTTIKDGTVSLNKIIEVLTEVEKEVKEMEKSLKGDK